MKAQERKERVQAFAAKDKEAKTWKPPTVQEEIQEIQKLGKPSAPNQMMQLGCCRPGTQFQACDLPGFEGTVICATESSVRVILRNGQDLRISPFLEVLTRGELPKPPEVKEVKAQKSPQPRSNGRPRIFGYPSTRLIYWLRAQGGWDFDRVKKLFEAFEVPISDSTIWISLTCKGLTESDQAPVTESEARKLEMAVEE